jgi:hypothetical protein
MAQTKKIAAYNANSVVGAPVLAASAAAMLQGVFVGLDTTGKLKPADYRASAGPIVPRGAMLQDAIQKDPKGNTLDTNRMGSYTFEGKIKGITDRNGAALTPGATYFLHSGGGISATVPAATTSDIDIEVGYALSTDELVIKIGPAVVHA